jgi:serine/threonine protein kinase
MMPFDDELDEGPLSVGQLFLNKYEVIRLLGRGGYAFVYEAQHRFMEHRVAIKVLHRQGGVSRETMARGQVEARILQRAKHPNVVQIDDAGMTDEGQLYMIMELLEGRTLQAALFELGRLEVEEVLRLTIQLARGMHAAHQLGAVHRDLKPANVFLTAGNHLTVIDFGVAKAIDLAKFATQKNMMLGTPNYMSPEQVLGKPLTLHTDIYTLGVIMYEALSGIQPVDHALGSQPVDVLALARVIAHGMLTPLDELDPRIPRYVADLVATACSKKPEERFASMAAVAIAAEECLARYTIEAKRSRRELQTRDLSRQGKVRSGVEVKDSSRARAAVSADARMDAPDTEQTAAPFSAPALSSGPRLLPTSQAAAAEPVARTAPLVRPPASSERPTVWVKPGSGLEPLPPMHTAPIGSPPSRAPSRPPAVGAAAPASVVAKPALREANASNKRSARSAAPPAPVSLPLVVQSRRPARPAPAQAPGHHLRTVLVVAALAGFTAAGAIALFLPHQTTVASSQKVDPTKPPAADPNVGVPAPHGLPAPVTEPTAAVAPAASTTSAAPPHIVNAAPAQPARPPVAPSVRNTQPPAVRPTSAASAPSKAAIDKMEQKLRRLEQDLDKPQRLWGDP